MKHIQLNEMQKINGGFGIGAALFIGGALAFMAAESTKIYNSSQFEDINKAACSSFGRPLPFKSCS